MILSYESGSFYRYKMGFDLMCFVIKIRVVFLKFFKYLLNV